MYKINIREFRQHKKIIKVAIISLLAVLSILIIRSIVRGMGSSDTSESTQGRQEVEKVELAPALASQELFTEFSFPLKDKVGTEVSKIIYTVESVETRDEIIIKGEKATSIEGRQFLIVTVKIRNDYEKGVQINSKDYIRLGVNNTGEWAAPVIHNDPVEVQAISTKTTRLGFTINESDTDLILRVGEITGEKQEIPLNLQ